MNNTKSVMKVYVTPETAVKYLANNYEGNRRIRRSTVSQYASDMLNGNFNSLVGQMVVLHEDGTLLDGQHRLSAVIESGVPMWFNIQVVDGDKESIFIDIDKGLKRTASDSTEMSNNESALARIMCAIERGTAPAKSAIQGKMTPSRHVTLHDQYQFFKENKELIDVSARAASRLHGCGLRGSTAGYAAWIYMSTKLHGSESVEFFIRNMCDPSLCECPSANATVMAIMSANANNGRGTIGKVDVIGIIEQGFQSYISGKGARKQFNKREANFEKLVNRYISVFRNEVVE